MSTKSRTEAFNKLKKQICSNERFFMMPQLRFSKYAIFSPFIDENDQGQILVFSSKSGKIVKLSANLYNKIKHLEEIDSGGIIPQSIIDSLIENQILVPKDLSFDDEVKTVLRHNRSEIDSSETLYVVIQPNAYCNFGCGYCGQDHVRKALSDEHQDKILNLIITSLKNGSYKNLSIAWFGSEPTIVPKTIMQLSERLITLSKKHGLNYFSKMVTNGFNLTKDLAVSFLNDCMISSFEITLDGPKEIHDSRRYLKNKSATFAKIVENIKTLVETKAKVTIRCNVDKRNQGRVIELAKFLKDQNLHKKVSFYNAPVHSWGNDAHQLSAEQQDYAKWEIQSFDQLIHLGFDVRLMPAPNSIPCMGVNKHSILIDPYGNLFGCTEESLVPAYVKNGTNTRSCGSIGKLNKSETIKTIPGRKYNNFPQEISQKKWPCHDCHVLPLCGGKCPKEWHEGRAACPPFKYNLPERILLNYARTKIEKTKAQTA
ncbi:MAG: radical SAM protein [Oligoflexales bacterium]